MNASKGDEPRPISALEGTWPLEEWPLDVQRVDENGIDLSVVEESLRLTPAERLDTLEEFARFTIAVWQSQGCDIERCINSDLS
jgi:hypothetical protein